MLRVDDMSNTRQFYEGIADVDHLIFEDWDRSISRQGDALAAIIERWPQSGRPVLDVSSGIGTQAIGLALLGYDVVGSDISVRSLSRPRRESRARGVRLEWVAGDFRALPFRARCANVALACDNALPHLLSLPEIHRRLPS